MFMALSSSNAKMAAWRRRLLLRCSALVFPHSWRSCLAGYDIGGITARRCRGAGVTDGGGIGENGVRPALRL